MSNERWERPLIAVAGLLGVAAYSFAVANWPTKAHVVWGSFTLIAGVWVGVDTAQRRRSGSMPDGLVFRRILLVVAFFAVAAWQLTRG